MKIKGFPSKSNQVLSYILDEISSGKLTPGSRLASVRELARQFSVSNKVVEIALESPDLEKLLVRKPRSGIYIAGQKRRGQPTIALFSETKGHVYEHQANHMVIEFQKRNHLTFVIDIIEFLENKAQQEETFKDLLDRKLDGIVIDGQSRFPVHLLIKYMDKLPKMAFFNRFEFNHIFEALYVLSDTDYGVGEGTRHLLNTGRKKVMFITHDPVLFINTPTYPAGDHLKSLEAYRNTVRELGAPELIFYSNNSNNDKLEELLRSSDRPDAIFSYGDSRAKTIMDICEKIGLKVPADIAVLGYYDTPWTVMLNIPLSSVSTREELIAETVVSKMTTLKFMPEKIYIKPEVKIRSSTAPKTAINN